MPTPPLLSAVKAEMQHLAARQRVLAQNIANSETPGYKARDVEAPSFAGLVEAASGKPGVARPQVQLTSGMAALGARQPIGASSVILQKDVTETKPDGNNVTLEDQLLKLGSTQADFTALTGIYRKQLGLLKIAAGKGGN
jgi:flagellar basal-body rod protein FlgB